MQERANFYKKHLALCLTCHSWCVFKRGAPCENRKCKQKDAFLDFFPQSVVVGVKDSPVEV